MRAIDHVAERSDGLLRLAPQPYASKGLAIDGRYLFARAQVSHGCCALGRRDPKRDTVTGAAAVEPEYQARPLRRAAMHERIDAERAMRADEPSLDPFNKGKIRPP